MTATMERRTFLKALGLPAAAGLAPGALAQGISGRPLRMIVPLPPGTSNDSVTRVVASVLGPMLGQAIVVDNRAGASGVIGTSELIRANPDGLTLMNGSLSPLATNVAFVKNLPYDPMRDLTPIAGTSITNHVLVVKPDLPIKTFAEFLAYAKERPGQVSVGYSTSIAQLQIVTMNKLAGIELQAVPYRGVPASVTDVLGGTLTATLGNPGPTIAYEKSGRLRPLAVSSLKRSPVKPDWPAMSETLPGFDFPSWNAVVGPPGMAAPLVAKLSEAIGRCIGNEEVIARFAAEATSPLALGPDELKAYMQAEITKYVQLGREAGIQPE